MTEDEMKQLEAQNKAASDKLAKDLAAMREQKLAEFRLYQAAQVDIQRAIDKDRKERAAKEEAQKLGAKSDSEFAEYCRKNFGFNP